MGFGHGIEFQKEEAEEQTQVRAAAAPCRTEALSSLAWMALEEDSRRHRCQGQTFCASATGGGWVGEVASSL